MRKVIFERDGIQKMSRSAQKEKGSFTENDCIKNKCIL